MSVIWIREGDGQKQPAIQLRLSPLFPHPSSLIAAAHALALYPDPDCVAMFGSLEAS